MKKFAKRTAVVATAMLMAMPAFGCGGDPVSTDDTDGKRIEVEAVVAGYGVDWLHDMAARFNEVYADQGYEVVVTLTDAEINAQTTIKTPNRCTTDIFFEYNNINKLVNQSKAILKKDGVALLEDLSDVWNSPAINANKQEEGKPIIERMHLGEEAAKSYKYTGRFTQFQEGIYGIPWQGGSQGMYVNPQTLTDRGYSLDDLLTTDDLLATVDAMAPKGKDEILNTNNFFPVSWSGAKAPGYWDYLMQVLFAQYEGAESYKNFWDFQPDTGDTVSNGYSVYEKKGILEALKVVEKLLNKDYATPGTTSMDHITAEARVAEGKSMMVIAGDYLYKELEKDYSDVMGNVIAVKTPVVSALGVKLGLCGTAHTSGENGYESCAACNTKLRNIVKAVDEGVKTDAEIASEQGVTADKVKTVREARGYYLGGSKLVCAFIPAYSDAKKGAKLFLRFMYSDEGMQIYRNRTYVDLPVSYTTAPEQSTVPYVQAMYNKMFSANSKCVVNFSNDSKVRDVVPMFVDDSSHSIVGVYQGMSYSHSQSTANSRYTPLALYTTCKNGASSRWTEFLDAAGYEI